MSTVTYAMGVFYTAKLVAMVIPELLDFITISVKALHGLL